MTGAIVAAVLIAVIVFFLSIPLALQLYLEVSDKFDFSFRFSWLFGRVKREFGPGRQPAREKPAGEEPAGRKKKRGWSFLDFISTRGLIVRLLRLVRDVFRKVHIERLEVDFALGLGDPADTAIFVSPLWLTVFLMRNFSPYPVRLRPVLTGEPYFQGHACVAVTLRPIRILPALLRFGFSRPGMRLLGMLLFSRWKRRK